MTFHEQQKKAFIDKFLYLYQDNELHSVQS